MFQCRRSLLREPDSLGHGSRNRPLQCWLALVFFASSISAQSHAQQWDACNPSSEVKAALDLLPESAPDQTKWGFHQKELEAIQALRRQYPNDIFVERRYIEAVEDRTERPRVIEEYKAKWMANSQNPLMPYLYGLVLIGPESSESIQLLNGALEKDPKFAWPHLSLAQIFLRGNFATLARRMRTEGPFSIFVRRLSRDIKNCPEPMISRKRLASMPHGCARFCRNARILMQSQS